MSTKQRNTDKDPYAGVIGTGQRGSINDDLAKNISEIEESNAIVGGADVPPQHIHNRKHRLRGETTEARKDNNPFHNDEAFEEFEMGRERPSKPDISNKNEIKGSYQATKLNPHSKGTAKQRAEESLRSFDWPPQ